MSDEVQRSVSAFHSTFEGIPGDGQSLRDGLECWDSSFGKWPMRASIVSARECPGGALSGSKAGHGWLDVPIDRIVRVSILILVNCIAQKARATDLDSSQTGYILTPAGNPYNVIAGANIDTTAQGSIGIYGSSNHSATWALTNNGTVTGVTTPSSSIVPSCLSIMDQ